MFFNSKFPFYHQLDSMDCGATCLRIIAKYYGLTLSLSKLKGLTETTRLGSSLKNISEAAESIGFRSLGVKINFSRLVEAPLPCIIFWRQEHFIVLYKIKNNKVYVADPAHGLITYSKEEFIKNWANTDDLSGIVLLLEPTHKLQTYSIENDDYTSNKTGFKFLTQYITKYKAAWIQLIVCLLISSLLQLVFPFITQSIVDIGIKNHDITFIYLMLITYVALFLGNSCIEIIRRWLLLHVSSRINIALISDFLIKLMKLPMSFFDAKITGDIMQRIHDHERIKNVLINMPLNTLFSALNIIIYSLVLSVYSAKILLIFTIGSIIHVLWVLLTLNKRKELDYKYFSQNSMIQSKTIELISGMQEIKLHNAERQQRWGWEYLQAKLFRLDINRLKLEQLQTMGSIIINQLKSILINVSAAKLVIRDEITLGMLITISYIVGSLSGPLDQLISIIYALQDASISLERLSEIHNKKEEEAPNQYKNKTLSYSNSDITFKNVSFKYMGALNKVLNNISFTIPTNKITAIVGASGSGKTTLMKLLLKFYEIEDGKSQVGSVNINNIEQKTWRRYCGAVMQDGYIFNDTIANNITIGNDRIDYDKLLYAAEIAYIKEYIEGLPLGYNTKIGLNGFSLSSGQKQRILIARAVYKDPKYIFFDEATSALDAKSEKIIMENLNTFFKNKTTIIIAHRLSTVKNADQILVLNNGTIIEQGNHNDLIEKQGYYYELIKNQLQLENLNNIKSE